MENDNIYYPFKISEYKNTFSLLLTDDSTWETFEQEGFIGNGHDWQRLIKNLLNDKLPDILTSLNFDSEADMFCVNSEDKDSLLKIATIVSSFYDNKITLRDHVSKYAQYE